MESRRKTRHRRGRRSAQIFLPRGTGVLGGGDGRYGHRRQAQHCAAFLEGRVESEAVRYLQIMATIPTATRPNERCRRRHPGPSALLFAFYLSACSARKPATPAEGIGTDGNLEVTPTLPISSPSLLGHSTYPATT